MRQIAISVLAVFIVFPAFADARLPVVNLAAGGVSARAAFGEPIVKSEKTEKKVASNVAKEIKNEDSVQSESASRKVASRSAVKQEVKSQAVKTETTMDAGEQIVAAADVLVPHRPSSDLWARSSSSSVVPLRLPSPQEFSVIRSDNALPEESLDAQPQKFAAAKKEAVSDSAVVRSELAQKTRLSELDAQIARLNELQRRAEESVKEESMPARKVISRSVVSRPAVVESRQEIAEEKTLARAEKDTSKSVSEDVKLSRMVVPMDDASGDVVVRAVERAESPRIATVRNDMTQMTPSELRKAFRKTFLSENKHLSTFQIDDRFDVASDMTVNAEGFTSERDLSEAGGIRPLEIKIKFRNEDAALSRDNYNLLTEYAGIVLSNPTRAVQVSIPQSVTTDSDARKLAARRLAIVEQVLRDNGISEQRILPVLSQRDGEGLVLRMISLDQYETLTKQQKDIFGDTVSKKTYRSMSW